MTDFASDSFTNTAGTTLSAHNAAWVDGANSYGISNANRVRQRTVGTNLFAYRTETPPSANYSVRADVTPLSIIATSSMGVMARRSTSADTCYFARLSTSNAWQLYKRVAGVSTLLGSAAFTPVAGNTYAIELYVYNSTIELYSLGEAAPKVTVTDTAITDAGQAGIFSSQNVTPSDTVGWHLDNFAAGDRVVVPDGIAGGGADNHRIYQRNGSTYGLALSGTYTGTIPTTIEARVVAAADGTTTVQDWTALTGATIASGNWSGVLSTPQGGMYRVEVRSKNGATVLSTGTLDSAVWGVGDLLACAGSSSAERWFTLGTYTPSATIRLHTTASGWTTFGTTDNGAAVALANGLTSALGIPIGMMAYGVGGSTVVQWSSTAYSGYVALRNAITAVGGKIAALLTMVGNNDAASGSVTSKAAHMAAYQTFIDNTRTHAGQPALPVFISGSQRRVSVTAAEQWNWVREAEKDLSDGSAVYFGATTIDLELSGDDVHLTPAGYAANLQRMELAILDVFGSGTYHRGPKINGIYHSGSTIAVTIQHIGGTDITPSSGVTGFAVADAAGTPAITTAVRTTAAVITLTTDRDLVAPVTVTYLSGANPDVTAAIKDNTSLALPLELETEMAAVPGTWTTELAGRSLYGAGTFTTGGVTLVCVIGARSMVGAHTLTSAAVIVDGITMVAGRSLVAGATITSGPVVSTEASTPTDTFAMLISEARGVLSDRDTVARFSDTDLLAYANDALAVMATVRPELFSTLLTHTCAQSAVQTLAISSTVRINSIVGVRPTLRALMDRVDPDWTTATPGTPTYWMPFEGDPRRFYVTPPATLGAELTVSVAYAPDRYALDDSFPILRTMWPPVVDYVVAMAEARNDESVMSQRSAQFMTKFANTIGAGGGNG